MPPINLKHRLSSMNTHYIHLYIWLYACYPDLQLLNKKIYSVGDIFYLRKLIFKTYSILVLA